MQYFITLDGLDFVGKSTQLELLHQKLDSLAIDNIVVKDPGGTVIGEYLRKLLKDKELGKNLNLTAELLLMNASRVQLIEEVIKPNLSLGKIVLCDRFYDSTIAYQVYGRGHDLEFVFKLVKYCIGDLHPDLTVLLQLTKEARAARILAANRTEDRIETAGIEFFDRVDKGFKYQALSNLTRIVSIDADGSPEEVFDKIWSIVKAKLINV